MQEITLSKEYIESLKKYLSFLKSNPTKEVLFFKNLEKNKVLLSKMDANTSIWVNLSAPVTQINFETDELALMALDDFLKYLPAIKYNKSDDAKIFYKKIDSGTSKLSTLQMVGKGVKYYLPLANPGHFIDGYDRKIPIQRDKNPTLLKAKFILKNDDINDLMDGAKIMGMPKTFGLGIFNDSINFYFRGVSEQQFEKNLDKLCSVVYDSYSTADMPENGGCKLFPCEFISILDNFACDFDIDYRVFKKNENTNISTLTAYGSIELENNQKIELVIGVLENVSTTITGTFSILLDNLN